MSEEQNAPVSEEQEKEVEGQNQEQEAASPNQEGESPKQEGEGSTEEGEGSTEEGKGSTEEGKEAEKPKKRRRRIRVTGVFHLHPYFWGSLKAVVNINIPGFSIRGIRIVQEKDEEEFRVYPPQGWVGRRQRSIVKVHNKEFWAQICEEVSKAYIASREKWEKKGKKKEEGEEGGEGGESQAEATQAEAAGGEE